MLGHYLYRHIRLDKNQVFYIGIGKKKYLTDFERAHEKRGRNEYWKNIVSKSEYEVEIMLESDSRDFIISKEKEFINIYGRKDLGAGTLVNLTDGGEGALNQTISDDARNKKSLLMKGRFKGIKLSEAHKKNISKGVKIAIKEGILFTKEHKDKISKSKIGHIVSEKTKEKIRIKLKKPKEILKKVNNTKFTKEGLDKLSNSKSKKLFCETNGMYYKNSKEAQSYLNISKVSIARLLNGSYKSINGIKLKYA